MAANSVYVVVLTGDVIPEKRPAMIAIVKNKSDNFKYIYDMKSRVLFRMFGRYVDIFSQYGNCYSPSYMHDLKLVSVHRQDEGT